MSIDEGYILWELAYVIKEGKKFYDMPSINWRTIQNQLKSKRLRLPKDLMITLSVRPKV